MENPKISIIVPIYNLEKYIVNTVSSICNQSYRNVEIILVDDGSTDGTLKKIEQMAIADSRIKIVHQENKGVTKARLHGVEVATGKWIGFVDGDDFIEPHMYETLMKNAVKYEANISHCGYQMVFPSRIVRYYGTGRLVEQDRKTGLKDLLEGFFVEPGLCNKLFQKDLFNEVMGKKLMDLSIKNNEDLLMNYYLFRESEKSVFIDECLYHYLIRKNSASTAKLNENLLLDPIKVLKILERETGSDASLQLIVKKRLVAKLINISTLSLKENKELIKPYRKKYRKELRMRLSEILMNKYSKKQKIMALWTVICPTSYGWVHSIYAKVSGIDKKYEVS